MKRARLAAAAVAAGWLGTTPAGAQPADAHAAAQAIVAQVAADPARRAAAAELLGKATAALEQAARLRAGGDEAHAKAADGAALEWAETARDLGQAVQTEARGVEVRTKAVEAQAQLERTRGLVEVALATVGRLGTELALAESKGREDRTAVESHDNGPPPRKRQGGIRWPRTEKPKTDAGGTP